MTELAATREEKEDLQRRAGIPYLPTDLTYQARLAMSGAGEFGYEWTDKPHRLVFRLCQHIEWIEAGRPDSPEEKAK